MKYKSLLLLLTVAVALPGCGAEGPKDPQAQVSGTVTNNGKPITLNSLVVFYNADKGLTLSGAVDSLGKYSLTPADPKIGVPAGRYTVAITPPVAAVAEVNQNSQDYMKMMQSGGSTAPKKEANAAPDIPEKFRDAKSSKLVFEVKEGANTFDFDLSKL